MSTAGTELPPDPPGPREERMIVSTRKESTKRKTCTAVDDLTAEEREAVTIVFHQFETGLREGTIFTKVCICNKPYLDYTKKMYLVSRVLQAV